MGLLKPHAGYGDRHAWGGVTAAAQSSKSLIAGATTSRPAFIIHDLSQACRVAAVAASAGIPVLLTSAYGAGGTLGPSVFKEIIDQAKTAQPDADIIGCLDCANEAGTALGALRHQVSCVILEAPDAVRRKVNDIAKSKGAQVIARPVQALDIADDPSKTKIDSWLRR